jgi:hypothetical protein
MSGRSALCCGLSTDFNQSPADFPSCIGSSSVTPVTCFTDLLQVVIDGILSQARPFGSTEQELFEYITLFCAASTIEENVIYFREQLRTAISKGVSWGTLIQKYNTETATSSYMLNAAMMRVNPTRNRRYQRCLCAEYQSTRPPGYEVIHMKPETSKSKCGCGSNPAITPGCSPFLWNLNEQEVVPNTEVRVTAPCLQALGVVL